MSNYYDIDKRTAAAAGEATPQAGTHWPAPSHNMVSEYQQSGIPFVFYKSVSTTLSEDSIITLTLPYVSRWIYLTLGGTVASVTVGFADISGSLGIQGDNYIKAADLNAITVPLEMKCKKILIKVPNAVNDLTISLLAGLTSVREFPSVELTAGISGISTAAAVSNNAAAIYSTAAYAS